MRTPKIKLYASSEEDNPFSHFENGRSFHIFIGKGRKFYLFKINERKLVEWKDISTSTRKLWTREISLKRRIFEISLEKLKELGLLGVPEVPES